MSQYIEAFEKATGQSAPDRAAKLDELFNQIKRGKALPPRGQQAVAMGLTAVGHDALLSVWTGQ